MMTRRGQRYMRGEPIGEYQDFEDWCLSVGAMCWPLPLAVFLAQDAVKEAEPDSDGYDSDKTKQFDSGVD